MMAKFRLDFGKKNYTKSNFNDSYKLYLFYIHPLKYLRISWIHKTVQNCPMELNLMPSTQTLFNENHL